MENPAKGKRGRGAGQIV
uniref:Uncharacterized protein n=1 Tax=Leersia perrieri TaxID=77586 RepID=A0A0D9W1Y9_9ORYZ